MPPAPAAPTAPHPAGWLVVDKPTGLSSNAVLSRLKRRWGWKKLGFVGTLDPLASGVLAVAVGAATRTIPLLNDDRKAYDFTLGFGVQTSSDDGEGAVVATHPHRPTAAEILAAIPQFLGSIDQRPPAFSAIKLGGAPAYALARAGMLEDAQMTLRQVRIDGLELLSYHDDLADFRVSCGSGTYVRSLARDLAIVLGTVGHAQAIRRLQSGPADLSMASSLDALLEQPAWTPLHQLLPPQLPVFAIDQPRWREVQLGRSVVLDGTERVGVEQLPQQASCATSFFAIQPDYPVILLFDDRLAGVGRLTNTPDNAWGVGQPLYWSPKMVFGDLTVCW